jgi:hypothetical protein
MAYHDDLFQHALDIIYKHPDTPTQADLRRSVSTAYYALFHLLISETVAHWDLASSRDKLARMFDHKAMKRASEQISNSGKFPFTGEDPVVVEKLKIVAEAFVQLQGKRHIADYDNSTFWSYTEAFAEIEKASDAFIAWDAIKEQKIAQEYLVSLLIKPRD